MKFSLRVAFVLGLAVAPAAAAPPTLTNLAPRGAERGKAVEVTLTGTNLTPKARLLVPFKAVQEPSPDPKPNPAAARVRLTIDASTPPGAYPIRVVTDEGVSAPTLFAVDVLPSAAEVEDNGAFDRAQKVTPPVVIDGQCAGGDLDFYRFPARKGQRLVIEAEAARLGAALLPLLRLTDDRRRFLAGDDTQALQGDGRIVFTAPADGEYVVELSDTRYRGGNPAYYRLRIADYDVADEVFPLGGRRGAAVEFTARGGTLPGEVRLTRTADDPFFRGRMTLSLDGVLRPGMPPPRLAVGELPERNWLKPADREPRALDILPPVTVNSRLEKPGDADRFQFPVEPGQRYRISVAAEALGSRLDGVLTVKDQTGRQLAQSDDGTLPPAAPGLQPTLTADPSVDLTVPAGAALAVVELRDQRGRGGVNFGYRLTVEPVVADFTLQAAASEINVPRGGTAVVGVAVTRRGYIGPVQLALQGVPAGWSVQGGRVPPNGTAGVLAVTAAAGATLPAEPIVLTVEGRGGNGAAEVRRTADVALVLNREVGGSNAVLSLPGLALGLAGAEPFAVVGPPAVEAVIGYPAAVPVRLTRSKDQAKLAIQVSGADPQTLPGQQPPPDRVAFQNPPPAAGDAATVTLTPGVNLPDGPYDLIVQGKARVGSADVTVTGPLVPVTVRRPFEVKPAVSALTLAPGAAASLRVAVQRQAVFKEAVQVRLDGLPAGVALAKPLAPVAAGASEFTVELKAAPTAAAATATLTLTCTATLGGRTYTHPAMAVPLVVAK